jgi:hypothetical protein
MALYDAWKTKFRVYIYGDAGIAGNANHLADEFKYDIDKCGGIGMRIDAFPPT